MQINIAEMAKDYYLYVDKIYNYLQGYAQYIFIIIGLIPTCLILFTIILHHLKGWRLFKRLKNTDLRSKENIYRSYKKLSFSKYWLIKYINLLANEVDKPSGKWPDTDIFNARTNDQATILLAQLEEKWRKLNR